MKKIAHISDLHFGRINEPVLRDLILTIDGLAPDLLVVSGDLTQRARSEQFTSAAQFLERFKMPKIVVPGNHDIPLYNVIDRFVSPLEKYKRFISNEMMPSFHDEDIAVVGLNTARSLTIKDGRLNDQQIADGVKFLQDHAAQKLKIVVTHHPLDIPEGVSEEHLPDNAENALKYLAAAGGELFLSGHLHVGNIVHLAQPDPQSARNNVLMIQAGTACSTRSRVDHNSFNVINIANNRVEATELTHDGVNGFKPQFSRTFERRADGWAAETSAADNFHL